MTNNLNIPPFITNASLEERTKPWLADLLRQEIVAVIGYPQSNTRMVLLEMIGNRKLLVKNGINPDAHLFLFVDFRVDHIEEGSDMENFIIHKLKQYHLYNSDESVDLNTILARLQKKIIILALGSESLIFKRKTGLLQWLSTMSNYSPLKTILFFECNLFSEETIKFFSEVSEFHPPIYYYQFLSEEESKQYLIHLSTKWDISLNQHQIQKILGLCGGNYIFIKEVLRFINHNHQATLEEAYQSLELEFALSTFYNSFNNEKDLLDQIAQGSQVDEKENKNSLRYLTEIGLVLTSKKGLELTIPLLKDYILKKITADTKLIIKENLIYVGKIPISINFSKREQALLTKFIEAQNKALSREEIARTLWPKIEDGSYSDWALDSHISRIRRKLISIGLPKSILTTKKGQGVSFTG